MTPGKLNVAGREAAIDDGGVWASADAGLAESLNRAFAPPPTAAGVPWVAAFWRAARTLGGRVTQEPRPAPSRPGTVH